MQSFSREAAATFAQHKVQQKRIERIKAVRNKEKQLAKQQRVQYVELQQLTKQQIQNEMEIKWEINKENELQKLTNHYNNLQSSIGSGHESAHTNIDNLQKTAILNQQKIVKQHLVNKQRAFVATSKLQQKLLNEQNQKGKRAQWREKAIKMAKVHRNKLQKQLQHQYFALPPGLAPQNASTVHDNSRYTLLISDDSAFNPHPRIYVKEIESDESYKEKTYNLRQYLPSQLLHKLNKKYSKKRKKNKRRKKKEEKFKAAGIRLVSDGNAMLSIPENNTCFHSKPAHVHKQKLQQQQQICEIMNNNNCNPWDEANKIRKQTVEKETKQTQQIVVAQKRGKIALQKEIDKKKSKQLNNAFEALHQRMIQEKLQKCQQILDKASTNNCATKLQAELEENFEDLFQIHSNINNKEEIKPRVHAPKPQSFSSSTSVSLHAAATSPTQSRQSLPSVVIPSVPIPTAMSPQISMDEKAEYKEEEEEEEKEEEESSLSVTKSRRIKLHKNEDGSTSVSESTSVDTSPQKAPEQNGAICDKVIVPKKWFESLLIQMGNEENSETESEIQTNITHHSNDQIAMNRTWFEQLLQNIYNKKQSQATNLRKSMEIQPEEHQNENENEMSVISRKSATNSPSKSTDIDDGDSEMYEYSQPNEPYEAKEDEFNLIFKRQKAISVLSEMLSDADNAADDADDEEEYDHNEKPNNLRTSTDSIGAASDLSQCSSTISNINIEETSKFIRESAALLDQTANFFENFSESSMDYTKTDKSKQEMDKILRSSIQSDSSNASEWSLSSLSSIEFSKLPDSLHKLDQFLSHNQKPPQTMQTIQEMNERNSGNEGTVSSFTIQSNFGDSYSNKPNTPKLFEYHSEEEKESIVLSEKSRVKNNKEKHDNSTLNKQHFVTPTNTTHTNTAHTNTTHTNTKSSDSFNTPRVTDSTIHSYPSLPPSNKTCDHNNMTNNINDSLLPIQHLNFVDIHVSDSEHKESAEDDLSSMPSLTDLKNFNQEMDDTLKQILKMKISTDEVYDCEENSFLSMKNNDNNNESNAILSSINVSQIEPSHSDDTAQSYHSIADVMAKLSNLSTSSFSLSTFNDGSHSQQSGATNERLLLSQNMNSESTIKSNVVNRKFPPLTPQDLDSGLFFEHINHINRNNVDMDLESAEEDILNSHNSLDDGKYIDMAATGNSILRIGDLDIVQEEPDDFDTEPESLTHSKTSQQIEIGKKLETLKSREKQKKCKQIIGHREYF